MSRLQSLLNKTFSSIDSATIQQAIYGKEDAEKNIPASDETVLRGRELEVIHAAQKLWGTYKAESLDERTKLTAEISELQNIIESDKINLRGIEAEKAREINAVEAQNGLGTSRYVALKEQFEICKGALTALQNLVKRPLKISMVKYYLPLLAFLSVVEIPVNYAPFELFFEGRRFVMICMAAAIGALLLYFAHIVGLYLRRSQCEFTSSRHVQVFVSIGFLLLFILALMYSLGLMRDALFMVDEADKLNLEDLLSVKTDNNAVHYVLGSKGWALFGMNIAIFICGSLSSFLRHDPHPDYEEITRQFDIAKGAIRDYESECADAMQKVERNFAQRYGFVIAALRQKEARLSKLKRESENFIDAGRADMDRVIANYSRLMAEYRRKNISSRAEPAPNYFSMEPEATLRKALS